MSETLTLPCSYLRGLEEAREGKRKATVCGLLHHKIRRIRSASEKYTYEPSLCSQVTGLIVLGA